MDRYSPVNWVTFMLSLALVAVLANPCQRAFAQTQAKSSSSKSSLHLPHLPNPITALENGAKKVASAVGSLIPGKQQSTSSTRYYPPEGSKKKTEKKGLFSWLAPKPEPKKSDTVCDWIGREPLLP